MDTVENIKAPKECCSTRNVLWYLVFTGFAVNYMIRLNLNIAIVSMIKPKVTTIIGECEALDILISTSSKTIFGNSTEEYKNLVNDSSTNMIDFQSVTPPLSLKSKQEFTNSERIYFDWNEKEQGYILGSYFWLHWATQIPGGILASKYGTKRVFGWSNFLGVLCGCLIPWFAHRGTLYLTFIRGFQGLLCGFCWPSMHNMTAKWIPPNQRSKFVTAYMGSSVGAAMTYPLCGFIIDKWGWEMVFYASGVIGTIWYLAWCFLVYDSPSEHPRISKEEKDYILVSLGNSVSKKPLSTPWKAILTDNSLFNIVILQLGSIWGFFTLMVNAPLYFKVIHGWNIQATGILSGMPHFFRLIFAYCVSILGDYLLRTNKMNTTNVRKLAGVLCCGVQGIFMLGLAYSGCNKTAAVIFMTLAIAVNGAVSTGPLASLVDVSPNYSAIMLGICNTLVALEGFITPAVVGFFTYQDQTTLQWQKVFWLCSAILFISCIYYVIFAKSELASWNSPQDEDSKHPEEEMMVYKLKLGENNEKDRKKDKTHTEKIMYSNEAVY